MICAHAVSVTFKRTPGVQSVEISLNKGLASLKLAPDNTARIGDLWEAVRKNGFTPKDTKVTVRGTVLIANGKPQLKVSGTNQSYDLPAEFSKHAGETVVIVGVMTPSKDTKAPVPIRMTTIQSIEKGV